MFVDIHAAATTYGGGDPLESPGNHRSVRASQLEITEFNNELCIRGSSTTDRGSGVRGGSLRSTTREAVVNFDADELQRIFEFAIENGLIEAPGQDNVQAAIDRLQVALKEMKRTS